MRDISNYAEEYVADYKFEKYQVKYRRKRVLESVNKYNGKCVLEIGCGLESVCLHMENYDTFVIVEPAAEFYNNAVKSIPENKNVICIQDFFENSLGELKKYKFDIIILSSLLHEVEDPIALLRTLREASGVDTICHINVPNADSFHRILAEESGLISDKQNKSDREKQFQVSRLFTMDSLEEMIKSVDRKAEIIDKGSYFIKPFTHKQMMDCMEQGILNDKILDGFYNMVKYMPDMGSEIFIDFKFSKEENR